MRTDITIVKNIRDDAALRSSFNRLAEKTFDLNFENWYQNGYWKENYIPYAAVREGQVIANVYMKEGETLPPTQISGCHYEME